VKDQQALMNLAQSASSQGEKGTNEIAAENQHAQLI